MKKTLYIFQKGRLRRKDNSLLFEGEETGKKFIPVEDTNDLYLFGEVDISKSSMEFLSQKEICVHYFNQYYGYYMGTFYPREHLNSGHVILKQAEHYIDYEKRVDLARQIIFGSISQMTQVLNYYKNRIVSGADEITAVIDDFKKQLENLDQAKEIEELMAEEGHAREKYYSLFDYIIQNKDFPFEKRTKRPPLNRLNALISFGNSLCYTIVLSETYKTYLDPRIGFLHSTNFRRFSLNLDVAEIFKPIIVDRLIFSLLNRKQLNKKHFDKHTNAILLSEEGRKIFIRELDERLKQTKKHRGLGRNVSNRRLIRLELYKIQKHLLEEKEYKPYKAQW
ncbi:type I-B CRISPR-associated endonuclease Cas1b [Natranaerofaba carboxydovora]|uniref:type I-B CRISPR-associated endonuclease Cas1b n=1 Tax=Natranaerofaba carboxydovora TaxID=2742683 RepID=UPI001F1486C5|nr:type I-B CRISPR-associated endonuclease Cas1b [Natranaerofaba carboxydovora]UMZ72710.1 CRISPR-associated endonuclease Cas1 [Natranaerofaba carboxydovora]